MLSKIKTSYLTVFFIVLLIFLFILNSKNLLSKFSVKNSPTSISSIARDIKVFCLDNLKTYGSKENCYAQKFNKIGEESGPKVGFEVLDNLQKIDKDAIGCHLIAHGLGGGSYKREPNNWNVLVQSMPTICNYGAIHGVLESYIGSLPVKSMTPELILSICGATPRADCNHIVGHLLLVETDADINKALDMCDIFKDRQQNDFCISGVFMEYQTALNLIDHKLVPKSWLNWSARVPELEKICRAQVGVRAEACWEEIVHAALVKFNNDPKKIFDFCTTSQSPNGAKRCKRHSIGIMGASKNFDLTVLKSMCALSQKDDPNFEKDCYPALVSSALSTIPSALKEAVSFCSSLKDEFKQSCFSMIGNTSQSGILNKKELEKVCSSIPSSFRHYCIGQSSSFIEIPLRNNN